MVTPRQKTSLRMQSGWAEHIHRENKSRGKRPWLSHKFGKQPTRNKPRIQICNLFHAPRVHSESNNQSYGA